MNEYNNNQISPPIRVEETQQVEEIVSPVQPVKRIPISPRNVFAIIFSLVLIGATGYLLYEKPSGIKVAQAPETNNETNNTSPAPAPVAVVETPPTEEAAVPRTSSTSTSIPSTGSVANTNSNPVPIVAGVTTPKPSTKTYTEAGQYGIVIPSSAYAVKQEDNGYVLVVYGAKGVMLGRIEITDFLLDSPSGLGDQLRLSSSITNLQPVLHAGYAGFTYKNNSLDSLALIKGSRVYYVTNYSADIIQSFTLIP